ncbi:MAG: SprT family zinc-dependent metalloprotease [Pseudomonadota bacterium]
MQKNFSQLPLFPSGQLPLSFDFEVRRSRRTRRLSLSVHPTGRVVVSAPMSSSDRVIADFVRSQSPWVAKTQRSFAERYGERDRSLPNALDLRAIGRTVDVEYRSGGSSRMRTIEGQCLTLIGNVDDEEACRRALKRWVSNQARIHLGSQLGRLSDVTGLNYEKLQIRAQRSCWGSHSSSGTISLNLSLMFLAPALVRYLLIHELSHARHMNHSAAFWATVGQFEPDYRRLDTDLGNAWTELPGWLELG